MGPPASVLLLLISAAAMFGIASALCTTDLMPVTPRTPGTFLQCRQRCVGDGKGQFFLMRSCDAGDFDSFCRPSCCFCTGKVNITCRSGACLLTAGLRARVIVSKKPGFKLRVIYIARSKVYDKNTRAAGRCRARSTGVFFATKTSPISNEDLQNVKSAILIALTNASGKVVCEAALKKIAMNAADEAL